jgi:diguanylate cyclase
VVYQPKWDLAARRVVGAEALVRWRHPTLGSVSPDRFIPLLEESGNIARLTLKVLDAALAELARGDGIGIAVNVSAALLDDAAFVETLRGRLTAHAAQVPWLTIEVTETAELTAESSATSVLAGLRALGCRVSIDDYGTGRATLTYLHAFPADEIKIDKSFVTDMLRDENARIMVRSTIAMAHELGIKVVAEGIEDAATLEALTDMRCDTAQGWHIGKPMPAADLRAMLTPAEPARRAAA